MSGVTLPHVGAESSIVPQPPAKKSALTYRRICSSTAVRGVDEAAKHAHPIPAPGYGRQLEQSDLHREEASSRRALHEEASWEHLQLRQYARHHLIEEVLLPRTRFLHQAEEPRSRRDIVREERSDRQDLWTMEETRQRLEGLAQQLLDVLTLETIDRKVLQESRGMNFYMIFADFTHARLAIEEAALCSVGVAEERRKHLISRPASAVSYQSCGSVASHVSVSSLPRECQHVVRDVVAEEVGQRAVIEAHWYIDVCATYTAAQIVFQCMQKARHPSLLHAHNFERADSLGDINNIDIDVTEESARSVVVEAEMRARSHTALQYVRALEPPQPGSPCVVVAKPVLGGRARLRRKEQKAAKAQEKEVAKEGLVDPVEPFCAQRTQHRKYLRTLTEALRTAEEYEETHALSWLIEGLGREEVQARTTLTEDETWTREELGRVFRFVLVDDLIAPRRRALALNLEPMHRDVVLTKEADDIAQLLAVARRHLTLSHRKEALQEFEARSRSEMVVENFTSTVCLAMYSVHDAFTQGMCGLMVSAVRERGQITYRAQQASQRGAMLCAEADERSVVTLHADLLHVEVAEGMVRPVCCAQQFASFTSLFMDNEAALRHTLAASRLSDLMAFVISAERSSRYRLELCSDECFLQMVKSERSELGVHEAKAVGKTPQIVAIQRFFRGVYRTGEGGRIARLEILRSELAEVRGQRKVAEQRRLIREQIERGHVSIRSEEAQLQSMLQEQLQELAISCLANEAAARESILEESTWQWSRFGDAFLFGADEILFIGLRKVRVHEEYWRTRVHQDETDTRSALIHAAKLSFRHTSILPAQRAVRVHLAKRTVLLRIAHLLDFISNEKEWTVRTSIMHAFSTDLLCLQETAHRNALHHHHHNAEVALLELKERVCRCGVDMTQYAGLLTGCREEAAGCRTAIETEESVSREEQMFNLGFAAHAVILGSKEAAERGAVVTAHLNATLGVVVPDFELLRRNLIEYFEHREYRFLVHLFEPEKTDRIRIEVYEREDRKDFLFSRCEELGRDGIEELWRNGWRRLRESSHESLGRAELCGTEGNHRRQHLFLAEASLRAVTERAHCALQRATAGLFQETATRHAITHDALTIFTSPRLLYDTEASHRTAIEQELTSPTSRSVTEIAEANSRLTLLTEETLLIQHYSTVHSLLHDEATAYSALSNEEDVSRINLIVAFEAGWRSVVIVEVTKGEETEREVVEMDHNVWYGETLRGIEEMEGRGVVLRGYAEGALELCLQEEVARFDFAAALRATDGVDDAVALLQNRRSSSIGADVSQEGFIRTLTPSSIASLVPGSDLLQEEEVCFREHVLWLYESLVHGLHEKEVRERQSAKLAAEQNLIRSVLAGEEEEEWGRLWTVVLGGVQLLQRSPL